MITAFPFFTIFFIFVTTTFAYRAYREKKRQERDAAFWKREEDANHVPAVDLSTLEYIHIPLSDFPIAKLDSDEAGVIEDELCALANTRILNLTGMTNTDLRMTYGTDNFDKMQVIGENFDRMETLLCDYSKLLMENGLVAEAIPVLEFAVSTGTTISSNYELLAECYSITGDNKKLTALIDTIKNSELMMKDVLLGTIRPSTRGGDIKM